MEFARQVRRPAPVRQAAQQERDGKMTFAPAIVHRVLNEPGRPLGAEAPGAVASVLANFTLAPRGISSASPIARSLRIGSDNDPAETVARRSAVTGISSGIGAHGSGGESGRLFFSGVRIHTDTGAAASPRVSVAAWTEFRHSKFFRAQFLGSEPISATELDRDGGLRNYNSGRDGH